MILSRTDDIDVCARKADHVIHEQRPDVVLTAEGDEMDQDLEPSAERLLDPHEDIPIIRVSLKEHAIRLRTTGTLPARAADLVKPIQNLGAGMSADRTKPALERSR